MFITCTHPCTQCVHRFSVVGLVAEICIESPVLSNLKDAAKLRANLSLVDSAAMPVQLFNFFTLDPYLDTPASKVAVLVI